MKSLIDPSELLAIARISGFDKKNYTFHFTFGGDALKSIKTPFKAYLFIHDKKPISSSEVLIPAARGLENVSGQYIPIEIASYSLLNSRGRLKIKSAGEQLGIENSDDLKGAWLCIEKRILENSEELFFFQFVNSSICEKEGSEPVGTVVDYFDNGSHGILVIKTKEAGEVLIPFVDRYVTFDKKKKIMYIPDFNLFLI